ncbi:MAG: RidA family protein [Acidobacteria bacterium]|nr:RidA family protein [Acidobacteriota bacterium]
MPFSQKTHQAFFALSLLLTPSMLLADKKPVVPKGASTAGPYSPGILSNGTLYVAGQIGRDEKGNIPDNFEDEVKACLANIDRILKEAGVTPANAVAVQVYLTDMDLFDRMNKVYMTYFPEPRPARTTVGVSKLVGKSRIEITVTADAKK